MGEKRLFYNGRVLDPEKGAVCGGALLAEDGIIRAVGKEEELRDAPGAEKVNLEGAFVMPAFLDAHSHFTQTACSFLQASLRGVSTEKELVCRIRAYIKESGAAPGAWVIAGDYDHNLMEGGKNPPLFLLDQAAPENSQADAVMTPSSAMGSLDKEHLVTKDFGEEVSSIVLINGSVPEQLAEYRRVSIDENEIVIIVPSDVAEQLQSEVQYAEIIYLDNDTSNSAVIVCMSD